MPHDHRLSPSTRLLLWVSGGLRRRNGSGSQPTGTKLAAIWFGLWIVVGGGLALVVYLSGGLPPAKWATDQSYFGWQPNHGLPDALLVLVITGALFAIVVARTRRSRQ